MRISDQEFETILSMAEAWVVRQEQKILALGRELSPDEQIDAYLIGVSKPADVRILEVEELPSPEFQEIEVDSEEFGLSMAMSVGVSYRYGIYLKKGHAHSRRLIAHELTHTMQYERLGSIQEFLRTYLSECLHVGYPMGALEQEAIEVAKRFQ